MKLPIIFSPSKSSIFYIQGLALSTESITNIYHGVTYSCA